MLIDMQVSMYFLKKSSWVAPVEIAPQMLALGDPTWYPRKTAETPRSSIPEDKEGFVLMLYCGVGEVRSARGVLSLLRIRALVPWLALCWVTSLQPDFGYLLVDGACWPC